MKPLLLFNRRLYSFNGFLIQCMYLSEQISAGLVNSPNLNGTELWNTVRIEALRHHSEAATGFSVGLEAVSSTSIIMKVVYLNPCQSVLPSCRNQFPKKLKSKFSDSTYRTFPSLLQWVQRHFDKLRPIVPAALLKSYPSPPPPFLNNSTIG